MKSFIYTAQDKDEKRTSGTIEAQDKDSAIRMLAQKDLIVVKLTPVKPFAEGFLGMGQVRISGEELLGFTQQLASMLDASVPIKRALTTMLDDTENPTMRQILNDLSARISEGSSLSEVLAKYPSVFSRMYVSMIAAGEAGGSLPNMLFRLSDYIEQSENIKRKVQSSLYYPTVIVTFAFTVMTFILLFGIPIFKDIYDDFGEDLPMSTRLFIDAGTFLLNNLLFIAIGLAILIGAVIYWLRTPAGKFFWDSFKLKIPVLGMLFRKIMISRFCRTLGTLYGAGVPLLNTMELVAASSDNALMERVLMDSMKDLKEGETISQLLRNTQMFTSMAVTMVATGEESGTLSKMLAKLTDFYERQVEITLTALMGLLEPIIMIGVGICIGVMIVILGVPILNISSIINK